MIRRLLPVRMAAGVDRHFFFFSFLASSRVFIFSDLVSMTSGIVAVCLKGAVHQLVSRDVKDIIGPARKNGLHYCHAPNTLKTLHRDLMTARSHAKMCSSVGQSQWPRPHLWSSEATGNTGKRQAQRKHTLPVAQGSVLVLRSSLDSA